MSKTLRGIITFISIIFVFFLVMMHKDEFGSLFQNTKPIPMLTLILLQIPLIALRGYPFKVLVSSLGYEIRIRDWAGLSFIANFLNLVLPYRPGMVFRYWYLKKHYRLPLSHFTRVSLFYFALLIACSGLMVVFPLFWIPIPEVFLAPFYLFLEWLGLGVLLTGFTLIGLGFLLKRLQVKAKSKELLKSFAPFIKHPHHLLKTLTGFIILQGLTGLSFYVTFIGLNAPLSFIHCIFIVGFSTLFMIVPLTPGNFGLLETALGGLTQALFGNFSLGFSAILLFRIAQLLISTLLGSGFCLLLLGHFFPSKIRSTL